MFTRLVVFLKISKLPNGVNWYHISGVGILAAIGFTISLFLTELAFADENYRIQATTDFITASIIAGLLGDCYFNYIIRKQTDSSKYLHRHRQKLTDKPALLNTQK